MNCRICFGESIDDKTCGPCTRSWFRLDMSCTVQCDLCAMLEILLEFTLFD